MYHKIICYYVIHFNDIKIFEHLFLILFIAIFYDSLNNKLSQELIRK